MDVNNFNSEINWDDEEVVFEKVSQNGCFLKFASDRLKDNESIVMAAVSKNGLSLESASKELKDNKEIVMAAVQQNVLSLQYASDKLKDDEEVVLVAVKQNGAALYDASDRLKDDKEIVLASVQNRGAALKYSSAKLRSDVKFCIECAKIDKNSSKYFIGEAKELFSVHKKNLADVESSYTASQSSIQKTIPVSNLTELIAQFKTIKAEYQRIESALIEAQQQITMTLKG